LEKETKIIKAEIISIGTEIVLGRVTNTNQSYLASCLLSQGFLPSWSTVVSDVALEIKKAIKKALSRADLLILTGGLGSTPDDLTRQAVAEALNLPLKLDSQAEKEIRQRLKGAGEERLNLVLKQAWVPKGSVLSFSSSGTAPGFLISLKEKVVLALPGVPEEAREIFSHFLPQLNFIFKNRGRFFYKVLRTYGLSEPELFSRLEPLLSNLSGLEIGFLPILEGVDLELMTQDEKSLKSGAKKIKKLLQTFVYGEGEQSLSEIVGQLLRRQKLTISAAESCTAGLLMAEITKQPGSSLYFQGGIIAYSNEVKSRILKVRTETLKQYGAVSEPCAYEMAQKVREVFQTDIGVSITGLAGPGGGSRKKPVGLVYLGLSAPGFTRVWKKQFSGGRQEIRLRAVYETLNILRLYLKGLI